MTATFVIEQLLNGLSFGMMLFLLAAGLSLVFGIMDVMHLSHGSLYVIGAYVTAAATSASGSFLAGVAAALVVTAIAGALLEWLLIRHLYGKDHLTQVLATFAVILIVNDAIKMIWGPAPILLNAPAALAGPVTLPGGLVYPAYRLMVIAVGVVAALVLYWLVVRTKVGMWVRAGASNRTMARMMGVPVKPVFLGIFVAGAVLCALAGSMLGPLLAVQIGMGEEILILALVVVVIGGIGSIRGALVGALLVGFVDVAGRAFLPPLLRELLPSSAAASVGPALAAIAIYVLMAVILVFKPAGLFATR